MQHSSPDHIMWYSDGYPDDEQPDWLKSRPTGPSPSKAKQEDPDEITPVPMEINAKETVSEDRAPETSTEEPTSSQKKKPFNARYYSKYGEYLHEDPLAKISPMRDFAWSGSSRRRPTPAQSATPAARPASDPEVQASSFPSFTPINAQQVKAGREKRKGRPVYESSEMEWRLSMSEDDKAIEESKKKVMEWDDGSWDPTQWK